MKRINYNDDNWLFPSEPLVTHDITIDDINYLWNCAYRDDEWAEGVTELVKEYDRNPGSGREYLLDELRIRSVSGTTIQFPFGDRIITFSSKPQLFRGENQDFPSSIPSLRRKTIGKSEREEEILRGIANLRIWQFWKFIWRINVVPYWEAKFSDVNYKALAQHYGFDTYLLDLTNDFRIALFFATTKYMPETDSFRPLTQDEINGGNKWGVIYHAPNWIVDFASPGGSIEWMTEHLEDDRMSPYGLDNGELDGMAFQIGFQPLMRCHHQSGYIYPMRYAKPLEQDNRFERMRFPQSVELSQNVFAAMDGGRKVFPQEGISEIRDILCEIQRNTTFSKDDLKCSYVLDNVDKNVFPTIDDFEKSLCEQGIHFIEEEMDYWKDLNRLQSVNTKYDNKDLLEPIGGMLHTKPEDRKFRDARCVELYGKVLEWTTEPQNTGGI